MISYICTREMRRILRNCKASAFVLKILLILLTVRGAEQGQSTSSSHTSRSESGGTTSEGSSTDLAVTYHQVSREILRKKKVENAGVILFI